MFTTINSVVLKSENGSRVLWLLFLLVALQACSDKAEAPVAEKPFGFEKPVHFPEPVYNFSKNPVTKAGFELGRALFYEPRLSIDNSVTCGSCHLQSAGFTQHGHPVSHGIFNRLGHRNSPPIMNLAWSRFFMWDGGIFDLDLLSIAPISSPIEMGEDPKNVVEKLKTDPKYLERFNKAFGTPEITTARMYQALSQFMLMCVSADSPYDRWRLGKDSISASARKGYLIYQQKCSGCHSGELFTDGDFHNNGLGQGIYKADLGRQHITLQADDQRKFKTPSLRNLAYTTPYMHDGRFMDLKAVLNFYDNGVKDLPTLDPQLRNGERLGIELSEEEKTALLDFLQTLNEPDFKTKYELSEMAAFE